MLDLETIHRRVVAPDADGLWLRDRLMPRFMDGDEARPSGPPPGWPTPRAGAVLALLYPHDDLIHLPLTVRTADLRAHSGEISLPGGRFDAIDGELRVTALREAWEELGVTPESVTVWAELSPVWIPVSNYQITPFVGWSEARPDFVLSPGEVAELIEAPIDLLLDPSIVRHEERTIRDRRMHIPYFSIGAHKVWGATSLVLAELIGRLTHAVR